MGPRRWGRPGLGRASPPHGCDQRPAGERPAAPRARRRPRPSRRRRAGRRSTSAARGGRRASACVRRGRSDPARRVVGPAQGRREGPPEHAGTRGETVTFEIHGSDLPGRSCGPGLGGQMYDNVHVGLWSRSGAVELVPGDAPSHAGGSTRRCGAPRTGSTCAGNTSPVARASARSASSGASSPTTTRSRSSGCQAQALRSRPGSRVALETGERLVCGQVSPTIQGHPRCASVRPPDLAWSLAATGARALLAGAGGEPGAANRCRRAC